MNTNSNENVVAIASGKGGTGKSVICASLGYALAHSGKKTLLVDLDLFTCGLTYYALSDYFKRIKYGLRDVFLENVDIYQIEPLLISNDFCNGNLYLLPSVSTQKHRRSELSLSKDFNDISTFIMKVKTIINHLKNKHEFENIIIDTRGGSDLTSVGAILAAESVLIVTEADKPSWDMGAVLINSIFDASQEYNFETRITGFIINKNVLPADAIELFLKKEWRTQHLATIPLSPYVIRFFQEDKVPIAEAIDSQFSNLIVKIVYKAFGVDNWTEKQQSKLEFLRHQSEIGFLKRRYEERKRSRNITMGRWIQVYGLTLAFVLILFKNEVLNFFLKTSSMKSFYVDISIQLLTVLSLLAIVYPSMQQVKELLRYQKEHSTSNDQTDYK